MKYLVMECHLSYAVLLDENGRFLRAANRGYRVGDTVTDIVEMQLPEAMPVSPARWARRAAAAVAACLLVTAGSLFYVENTACASVYLSINPQIRIDVNRFERVVSVSGVNADGVSLTTGYDHRRKDLNTVMDDMVDRAIDAGYLHEGGTVTLSMDGHEHWVASHRATLDVELREYVAGRFEVTVDVETKQPAPAEQTPYGDEDYGDSGLTDYGQELPAVSDSPYESETPYASPEPEPSDSPYESDTPYEDRDDTPYDEDDEDDRDDEEDADSDYGDSEYDG